MTRRTRLFLLISSAVLVVGLGTGLLASYMGVGLQTLTILGADGPDELAYVPRDSGLVAFANVREVMDSELRQQLVKLRPPAADRDGSGFEAETGINIERDIDTVVASLGSTRDAGRALVVARGRFDQPRIEALVHQRGGAVEPYKDEQILTITDDDHSWGLAFVEADVVVIGALEDVRRAIDTKSGEISDVTANDEVMRFVRDMRGSNAWAVGRFDALAKSRLPEAVATRLPPIDWFGASGRVNGGVEGMVRVEATTDQAATDLREIIRGFVALARMQTGSQAELAAMLSSLQLGGEGTTVSLAFSLPPEVIDAVAAMHGRHRGRATR